MKYGCSFMLTLRSLVYFDQSSLGLSTGISPLGSVNYLREGSGKLRRGASKFCVARKGGM